MRRVGDRNGAPLPKRSTSRPRHTMSSTNFYEVLGIDADVSPEDSEYFIHMPGCYSIATSPEGI